MKTIIRFTGVALMVLVSGCTTTTRPANAANRETPERPNKTTAADREMNSRYAPPTTGPGSYENR